MASLLFSFSDWADDQPDGNGECMGYSEQDNLKWNDFECDNFAASELWVGFICEATTITTTITTTTTTTTEQTTTIVNSTTTRPDTSKINLLLNLLFQCLTIYM